MSDPFVGEIRMFGGNFPPAGWAFCDGQAIPIDQNDVLFNLIGTTYGGDGQQTFGLPDCRGRVPVHQASGFVLGQMAGGESVTLTVNQIPNHAHTLLADENTGTQLAPANNWLATTSNPQMYRTITPSLAMNPSSITPTGGSQPHDNMVPSLVISFIISLFGIYPTQ